METLEESKKLFLDTYNSQDTKIPVSKTRPIIIKLSGINNDNYKKLDQPFDVIFSSTMVFTMQELCSETSISDGCIYGYTYDKDIILFILPKNKNFISSQEVASRFASIATGYFNKILFSVISNYEDQYNKLALTDDFKNSPEEKKNLISSRIKNLEDIIDGDVFTFSAMVFSVQEDEDAYTYLNLVRNECKKICLDALKINNLKEDKTEKTDIEIENEIKSITDKEDYTKHFLYGSQYMMKDDGTWKSTEFNHSEKEE